MRGPLRLVVLSLVVYWDCLVCASFSRILNAFWGEIFLCRKTNVIVRRLPVCMALGALVGGVQGTFHLMGNRLDSFYHEEDEFERKEKIRRTTRTPVEQTISELGEGRGAYTDQHGNNQL